jgi:hypothetical protein
MAAGFRRPAVPATFLPPKDYGSTRLKGFSEGYPSYW